MSEFAETIQQNLAFLGQNDLIYMNKSNFAKMAKSMENFVKFLKKFNTCNTDESPGSEDIKSFLRVLLSDDEEMVSFFSDMFQFGGAMYLLGSHFHCIKSLVYNPEFYAEKADDIFSRYNYRYR